MQVARSDPIIAAMNAQAIQNGQVDDGEDSSRANTSENSSSSSEDHSTDAQGQNDYSNDSSSEESSDDSSSDDDDDSAEFDSNKSQEHGGNKIGESNEVASDDANASNDQIDMNKENAPEEPDCYAEVDSEEDDEDIVIEATERFHKSKIKQSKLYMTIQGFQMHRKFHSMHDLPLYIEVETVNNFKFVIHYIALLSLEEEWKQNILDHYIGTTCNAALVSFTFTINLGLLCPFLSIFIFFFFKIGLRGRRLTTFTCLLKSTTRK